MADTDTDKQPWEDIDEAARTEGLVDADALARWMDERDLPGKGEPVETTFISGGSSNEIFEIRRGDAVMALRRPPRKVPEGRNETMMREFRVLEALNGTDVPHPEAIAGCDDPSVIGGCFYLMGLVDGWSPMGMGDMWPAPFDADLDRAEGPRLPARRRHRASGAGRLAREGTRGLREARRLHRAAGRPLGVALREDEGARAPGRRRRRTVAA